MARIVERPIVCHGKWRTVEYAICTDGSMPAKEFIESLDVKHQMRFATLFQLLADTGKISNSEQFKKEAGEIWAFKRYQSRIACFHVGPRWRLTHGFTKKGNRWPKRELGRAERIMEEDKERDVSKGKRR